MTTLECGRNKLTEVVYHVSDTVFKFTVAIEYMCRKYLDIRIASKQDLDIAHKITDDCYRSAEIATLSLS